MTIALITTTWGRPDLTELFFRYHQSMRTGHLSVVRFAAISPEDPACSRLVASASAHGFQPVMVPNEPLAEKHNTVLRAAKSCNPDAVLTVGSDDFFGLRFLRMSASALKSADACSPSVIHFYDIPSHRVIRRPLPGTGIRMFSRAAVDRMEWRLWEAHDKAKAMDSAMDARIGGRLTTAQIDHPWAPVLDIKDGRTHRVSFLQYEYNKPGGELDPDTFLRRAFPALVRPLRQMRAAQRA